MSAEIIDLGHAATAWLSSLGHAATAWLATYLVHSTVLLGAAWLATRVVASPRRREVVWRAAMLGGLATASVQVGLDLSPALGRYELGAAGAPAELAPTATEDVSPFEALGQLAVLEGAAPQDAAPWEDGALPDNEPAPEPAWWSSALAGRDLRHVGPTALALGALFAFGSIACGVLVLARRRRGQTRLTYGPLAEEFAALTGGTRQVELWLCGQSDTPYAAGILRARIVVPARVLSELSRSEQRALLAHELAHIERRDPVWLGLTRALQLCLPLQPLNALARRRLNDCAELLCDERAVLRTGDRLALAQSLAKVASWLVADDSLPDAACAMASHRSLLGTRVARILDEDSRPARNVQPLRVAALLALAGTAVAAPAVRLVSSNAPEFGAASLLDETLEPNELEPGALAVASSSATTPSNVGAPVARAAGELNDVARRELSALAATLDDAVDELETELAALKNASAGRALDPALTARVTAMEQRAGEVRSRAKRIRALLAGAASGGVEAPQGERRRAAAPFTPTRAR